MFLPTEPEPLQSQHLHSPKSRQKHQANGPQSGEMLTFRGDLAHHLSKVTEFVIAQSALPPLASELPNAFCRVSSDDVEASSMTEQPPQGSDRAAGHTGPAGGPTATALLSAPSGLARRDIRLHALDVTQGEAAHQPRPEQRLDVGLDPAPVHVERRRLDRSAIASENATGLSLLEIPIADFADGSCRRALRGDRPRGLSLGIEEDAVA